MERATSDKGIKLRHHDGASPRPIASPPILMGVLNLSPDSFSDGEGVQDVTKALERAEKLMADGADVLDVGAQSTRPGATLISEEEEWARLSPFLSVLKAENFKIPVSIDTTKEQVMLKAVDYGVSMINDVRGAQDVSDLSLTKLAAQGLSFMAMHMEGMPSTMQQNPLGASDIVPALRTFAERTKKRLGNAGFKSSAIWLDPGIGFGKDDQANILALKWAAQESSALNIAVGISRKSFLGRMLGIEKPTQRDDASKTLELGLLVAGVGLIRTHTVSVLRPIVQLLRSDLGDQGGRV